MITITTTKASICAGASTVLTANVSGISIKDLLGGIVWYDETGAQIGMGASITVAPLTNKTYTAKQAYVTGTELVKNGDFAIHPFMPAIPGISTDLQVTTPNGAGAYLYNVDVNVVTNGTWYAHKDHTTGSGYTYLTVNGFDSPGKRVWEQSGISLVPGKKYAFSIWVASHYPSNPAILQFFANNNQIGSAFDAPSNPLDGWKHFFNTFTATGLSTLTIQNQNTNAEGNDFALDDISLREVGELTASQVITISTPSVTATASKGYIESPQPVELTAPGDCAGPSWKWTLPNGIEVSSTAPNGAILLEPIESGWYAVESNGITDRVFIEVGPRLAIEPPFQNTCLGFLIELKAVTSVDDDSKIEWTLPDMSKKYGRKIQVSPAQHGTYTAKLVDFPDKSVNTFINVSPLSRRCYGCC